jgi:hypothetical protein
MANTEGVGRGDLGKAHLLRDTNVLKRRDTLFWFDLVFWRKGLLALPGLLCSPGATFGNCGRLTNLLNAAAPLPHTYGAGSENSIAARIRLTPRARTRSGTGVADQKRPTGTPSWLTSYWTPTFSCTTLTESRGIRR